MRLLRRNALGMYAVYGASILSGLVVTPIVIGAIGKDSFGVWSFITSITIFVALLDVGVGPSVVRFAAEARGRGSEEDTNAIASVGLFIYGVIAVVTIPVGGVIAWFVPDLVETPPDLVWPARIGAMLVIVSLAARFPLGLFYNLLGGQQRFDVQNLGNFVSTLLYAVLVAALLPHGGGLIVLGVVTLVTTLLRLGIPLAWLRSELPFLHLSRSYITRERIRSLASFSGSNFLIQVSAKIVFTTDVVVVGIVLGAHAAALYAVPAKLFAIAFGVGTAATNLLFPAFAEYEGAGEMERQRRLLLTGLRAGSAGVVMLAMPLIFIPDKLIRSWIGGGFGPSTAVMVILACVMIVHQPIVLFTQYLVARARQRTIAFTLIAAVSANVVLSVVLAYTVGLWGVALSTLITDSAALGVILLSLAAPVAGVAVRELLAATLRPLVPGTIAAVLLLGAIGRLYPAERLLELAPLGALWAVVCAFALWRWGFSPEQRERLGQELGRRRAPAAADVEPSEV
jgi:O-antigen/teichoic acid export membrane protein